MNFQWILLAVFAAYLIAEIAKAVTKPMLKNVLRLLCVPVAFILTFILQFCGVFQWGVEKLLNLALFSFGLISKIPPQFQGIFETALELITALGSTFLSPLLFALVFTIFLIVLRLVHVNLIVKYIEGRKIREEKKLLKARVSAEKKAAKRQVREESERIEDALDEFCGTDVEDIIFDVYEAPDNDDIEDMVDERVRLEKRRLKKKGFFKESPERKAISVVAAAVSGFLIFAVAMMPIFYTMSFFSEITDSIENTDADDSQIYKIVSTIDKHVVSPYEDSFVIQLYDSMALVDLMNATTAFGGYLGTDANGSRYYVDDVIKGTLSHGVRAGAEIMSYKSEREHLKEDLDAILANPMMVSILADVAIYAIDSYLVVPELNPEDPTSAIVVELMSYYKNADKATIESDLLAISGAITTLAEGGLLDMIVAGGGDISSLLSDEENLTNTVKALSGLSAFGTVMEGAFQMGIDMMGNMFGIPENDEAIYNAFISDLLEVLPIGGPNYDVEDVENFVKNCAASGKKVNQYKNEDLSGYTSFMNYVERWSKVESVFSHYAEDRSYGYFTIEVEGTVYIYNSSKRTITVAAESDYDNKISPLADFIHYLSQYGTFCASEETLNNLCYDYEVMCAGADTKGIEMAYKLINADGNYVAQAVNIEKMHASTDFEDWTAEEKAKDSELCVSIIMKLLGLMDTFGGAGTVDTGSGDITAMLDLFPTFGTLLDDMAATSCLKDLPPLLLEGLLSNEMFSQYLSPAFVHQINDAVASDPDICYEEYMTGLVATIKLMINAMGGLAQ